MGKVVELETKYYKLELLVKWKYVNEVNEMLIKGVNPRTISEWCKERGFSISHPKLYEYKEILQTAISKRISVERLLGIGVTKRSPIVLQALGITASKDMVKNEIDVLDCIIQRGFDALSKDPSVRIQDAMRAIELKNKLTGGSHAGLTTYGLDHLRELETAKMNAIVEIVKKYLPEDKLVELQCAITTAERNFYVEKAPELLEEYDKSMAELTNDANSTSTDTKSNEEVSGG